MAGAARQPDAASSQLPQGDGESPPLGGSPIREGDEALSGMTVVVPGEDPLLTPAAATALLRLLRKAHRRQRRQTPRQPPPST